MEYNLNNTFIFLGQLPSGKHQGIEIKVGRKNYLLDIEKDCASACIDLYRKNSKYADPDSVLAVFFEPNAIISKDIILNLKEMEKAQSIYRKYNENIIHFR